MESMENLVDKLINAAVDKPVMCLFVFLLGQLREQLSYLKGDNFFRFTCSDCSEDGKEQYERLKLTWQQVSKKLSSNSGGRSPKEFIGMNIQRMRILLRDIEF